MPILTVPLCIELLTPCCENPIMLYWLNSLGGLDSWQFECKKKISIETDTPVTFQRYIADISTAFERDTPLRTNAVELWQVETRVQRRFVEAVKEIYHSPDVRLLLPDGRYIRILIESGTYGVNSYDKQEETFSFAFKTPRLWTTSN